MQFLCFCKVIGKRGVVWNYALLAPEVFSISSAGKSNVDSVTSISWLLMYPYPNKMFLKRLFRFVRGGDLCFKTLKYTVVCQLFTIMGH